MSQLAELTQQVKETGDVIARAVKLIQGLSALLKSAGTDAHALSQVIADLDAQEQALASAIASNTIAEPYPGAETPKETNPGVVPSTANAPMEPYPEQPPAESSAEPSAESIPGTAPVSEPITGAPP